MSKSDLSASRTGKRVALVVPNPCDPDYRVVKQAETLARAGYQVTIFCTHKPGLPTVEVFQGVTYLRQKWNVWTGLISWFTGAYKVKHELSETRRRFSRFLAKTSRKYEEFEGAEDGAPKKR